MCITTLIEKQIYDGTHTCIQTDRQRDIQKCTYDINKYPSIKRYTDIDRKII